MTSVLWKELTAEELRARAARDAVVVLPVGSIEQHGPHLAVGVDTVLCERICKAAAERVTVADVVVAPTLWCGMAEHHMAFGGTFTFDIPTYRAVLLCLLKSIERAGFRRLAIINGHGGNVAALSAFLPDFARETQLAVLVANYADFADETAAGVLEDQRRMLHACEVETSLMLALAPGSVRPGRLAEAHDGQPPQERGRSRRKVARFRSFEARSENGVWGDARRSTAEKGAVLADSAVAGLARWLQDERVWN